MPNKSEAKTVQLLRSMEKDIKQLGESTIYYFNSKVVGYIVDVSLGNIFSVKLQGGKLVDDGITLWIKGVENTYIIDLALGYVADELLIDCVNLRGEKNPYPYITLTFGALKNVNIYTKHIIALCVYGESIFMVNKEGNITLGVKWKDSSLHYTEGLNAIDNMYLNTSMDTSTYVEVTDSQGVVL